MQHDQPNPIPLLRLGTSSWSSKDWVGTVYGERTAPRDFITEYAARFPVVEIDATFYATPSVATVEGWRRRTPEGFLFAAKVPRVITHERVLQDCAAEMEEFLGRMAILGDRLGPLLLQFPYFSRKSGVTLESFAERLAAFLPTLPLARQPFAVEVRNKTWLKPALFDVLKSHDVPLAFLDHPWMPRPPELCRLAGLRTGPFAYVRWLGDRHGIEKLTKKWDRSVVDRADDLQRWVAPVKALLNENLPVYGFFNNHYSGHAPADVQQFAEMIRGALGDG